MPLTGTDQAAKNNAGAASNASAAAAEETAKAKNGPNDNAPHQAEPAKNNATGLPKHGPSRSITLKQSGTALANAGAALDASPNPDDTSPHDTDPDDVGADDAGYEPERSPDYGAVSPLSGNITPIDLDEDVLDLGASAIPLEFSGSEKHANSTNEREISATPQLSAFEDDEDCSEIEIDSYIDFYKKYYQTKYGDKWQFEAGYLLAKDGEVFTQDKATGVFSDKDGNPVDPNTKTRYANKADAKAFKYDQETEEFIETEEFSVQGAKDPAKKPGNKTRSNSVSNSDTHVTFHESDVDKANNDDREQTAGIPDFSPNDATIAEDDEPASTISRMSSSARSQTVQDTAVAVDLQPQKTTGHKPFKKLDWIDRLYIRSVTDNNWRTWSGFTSALCKGVLRFPFIVGGIAELVVRGVFTAKYKTVKEDFSKINSSHGRQDKNGNFFCEQQHDKRLNILHAMNACSGYERFQTRKSGLRRKFLAHKPDTMNENITALFRHYKSGPIVTLKKDSITKRGGADKFPESIELTERQKQPSEKALSQAGEHGVIVMFENTKGTVSWVSLKKDDNNCWKLLDPARTALDEKHGKQKTVDPMHFIEDMLRQPNIHACSIAPIKSEVAPRPTLR